MAHFSMHHDEGDDQKATRKRYKKSISTIGQFSCLFMNLSALPTKRDSRVECLAQTKNFDLSTYIRDPPDLVFWRED